MAEPWDSIGILAALILANAVFVAAEFAIIGAPRTAIARRAAKGSRLAKLLDAQLRDFVRQDRLIATAQLGITFASLGLGVYGEAELAEWIAAGLAPLGESAMAAHGTASVLAILLLTYLHIVLGEMVPKAFALQRPQRTALALAVPMLTVQALLYPLVRGLNAVSNRALGWLRLDQRHDVPDRYHTPEELQVVVAESASSGLLQEQAGQMLQELLEFTELSAREVMVPRVRIAGVAIGASSDALRQLVEAPPHSQYPVHDGDLDRVLGAISLKELVNCVSAGRTLEPADLHPLPEIPETAGLNAVLRRLRNARQRMAVVIDEHGGTAGILTVTDLIAELAEEVDWAGGRPPEIFRDATGAWHTTGASRLEQLGERLRSDVSHPEVDSVNGLLQTLLGRMPRVGDQVTYQGWRFQVRSLEQYGVRDCLVTRETPVAKG